MTEEEVIKVLLQQDQKLQDIVVEADRTKNYVLAEQRFLTWLSKTNQIVVELVSGEQGKQFTMSQLWHTNDTHPREPFISKVSHFGSKLIALIESIQEDGFRFVRPAIAPITIAPPLPGTAPTPMVVMPQPTTFTPSNVFTKALEHWISLLINLLASGIMLVGTPFVIHNQKLPFESAASLVIGTVFSVGLFTCDLFGFATGRLTWPQPMPWKVVFVTGRFLVPGLMLLSLWLIPVGNQPAVVSGGQPTATPNVQSIATPRVQPAPTVSASEQACGIEVLAPTKYITWGQLIEGKLLRALPPNRTLYIIVFHQDFNGGQGEYYPKGAVTLFDPDDDSLWHHLFYMGDHAGQEGDIKIVLLNSDQLAAANRTAGPNFVGSAPGRIPGDWQLCKSIHVVRTN